MDEEEKFLPYKQIDGGFFLLMLAKFKFIILDDFVFGCMKLWVANKELQETW